ncbi:phospholipase [Lutibacter sp. HS1-25]|uniref:phospholipase A n=1 Tax=Lutibacter sp. HS1-25 TaxID=2485000 RepID=UPI0010134D6A|nr:phospholipase A [Lutibacter sp. HS1-25]RXP59488.1 phospholipase [Lutibacter sp. HS1-25]
MKLKLYLVFLFGIIAISHSQNKFDTETVSLSERWNLIKPGDKKQLFKFEPYKPVYILFANYTNNINLQPTSENPNNTVPFPLDLNPVELKFQLSFKTKILQNVFGEKTGGDFWIGYTQSSRWQIYNAKQSRPFRETNYEPEMIFILPTKYKLFGLNGVYTGVALTHQSNGRANPLSRSWNRVIFHVGLEAQNWSVIFKPWIRISEDLAEDDNPNIENYIGRAELLVAYKHNRHQVSFRGRHSLNGGDNNRGSVQFDYAAQLYNNLKIYTQFFHGYGESLIDFNHKQTTIGIGLSLVNWM